MDVFNSKKSVIPCILLAIFCAALYLPSLNGQFVYDDFETIVSNPYIKDLHRIPDYFDPWKKETWSAHTEQRFFYRPLLLLSFALNYSLSGLDPYPYRLVNLTLHILNVLLVFLMIPRVIHILDKPHTKISESALGCFLAALIFGIHPLQTEAVAYVVSRSSLLGTCFILCTMYTHLKALEGGEKKKPRLFYQNVSLFFFVCGLLTKEIVLALPLLIFLLSLLRTRVPGAKERWKNAAVKSFPYLGILFLYLLTRIWTFDKSHLAAKTGDLFLFFFTAVQSLILYLKLLILPLGQTVDHDMPYVHSLLNLDSLLAIAGILIILFVLYIKVRPFSKSLYFFSNWFFIGLIPNLIIPTPETVSEHSAYFPSIGFFAFTGPILMVTARQLGLFNHRIGKVSVAGFFVIVLIQLTFLTLNRNLVWQSGLSLWTDAVHKTPRKARPHLNLGTEYLSLGRLDAAMKEFEAVLRLEPHNASAHNNLGLIYVNTGEYEKAENAFRDSLRLKKNNPDALNNLGMLYLQKGCYKDSIPYYVKALKMRPNDAVAWVNLGRAHLGRQNKEAACRSFKRAIQINPDFTWGPLLHRTHCKP